MSQWVPTIRLRAVVIMADGGSYPGHLHLQDGMHGPGRPETPLEMINRSDPFFPLTLGEGEVFLVSKDQVAMVRCEWAVEDEAEHVMQHRRFRLEVRMASGEELTGECQAVLPAVHSRPLDYLNRISPFFELDTDGEARLINRAHVHAVRPLD
jgi:hypothetical protein